MGPIDVKAAEKELDPDLAVSLARRLKTIPGDSAYFSEDAILAIAADLRRWCKGAWFEGKPWSPQRQADWLVTEARETWQKWEGTAAFKRLFLEKFDPRPPNRPPVFEGYQKPPILCATCGDTGIVKPRGVNAYCDCDMGASLKADPELGEKWLEVLNRSAERSRLIKRPASTSELRASLGLPPAVEIDNSYSVTRDRIASEIAKAEAVLADEHASPEMKEIAREVIKTYRGEAKKKKAKGKLPWQI